MKFISLLTEADYSKYDQHDRRAQKQLTSRPDYNYIFIGRGSVKKPLKNDMDSYFNLHIEIKESKISFYLHGILIFY